MYIETLIPSKKTIHKPIDKTKNTENPENPENQENQLDKIIESIKKLNNYNLYLLTHSRHNKTYLGITNNTKRRLRQHNKEIKGGAKYTSINLNNGKWKYHLLVPNLSKSQSLSLERKIKNHRRRAKGKTPLDKRLYSIYNFVNKNEIIFI